tara:strand:+ start:5399 stop:7378 length:1980 start_codon:yes stop_codon:yes gene_type:complete
MAETKVVNLRVNSNLNDVSKDTKVLKQNLDTSAKGAANLSNNTASIGKSSGGVGALTGSLGKLSPALGGATGAATGLLKTLWALVANPIGAIIAAVVLSLAALYKAFTSTKAGGEQLERIMAGIGATFDVLRDRVLKIGGALVKFFTGDFKGAFKDMKASVSGLGAEIESEFKQAAQAKKYLQEVTDEVRKLTVSRAKLNRDLARSKEIINDETASYADKKKAIDEVRKAEEKQTKQELKNAEKKLNAIIQANKLSDTGAPDFDKQAEAEAALYSLQEKSATDRRNITKTEKRADNEEKSRIKEIASARATAAKERQSQQKELDKQREESLKKISGLEKDYLDSLLSAQDLELLNVKRKYEEQIKIAEKYGKDTATLLDAQEAENLKITEKYEAAKLKVIEDANQKAKQFKIQAENEYLDQIEALQEQNTQAGLTQVERERTAINDKYYTLEEAAIGNAEQLKIIAEAKSRDIIAVEEKEADRLAAIEKKKKDDKIQGVKDGLSVIGDLAELFAGKSRKQQKKAFDIQKAVNIAGATIDTYKAATAAYASMIASTGPAGPILAPLAAAAAITAGLLNVKKIASQKFDGGGSPSGGGGGGGGGASLPDVQQQAPSFNIVGNSNVNQLSQLQNQPMKAYVVSGDVSSAQSLDRNRIENATL